MRTRVCDIIQQHIAIVESLRGVIIESLQHYQEPLEGVTADASLERNKYHKPELHQLEKIDVESLYQVADCIFDGIHIKQDKELGWGIMIEAARRGHPVALGRCFFDGQGVKKNQARAIELLQASADRGHASGSFANSHSIFKLTSNNFCSSVLFGQLLF